MANFNQAKTIKRFVFLVAICVLGFYYIWNTKATFQDRRLEQISQISRSIVATLHIEDIRMLDVKLSDTIKPQYQTLKRTLKEIIRINKEARFAYIYTLRDDTVYFLADSEPEYSKDYSPPGQQYTEAKPDDKEPFRTGKEKITISMPDRWGTWTSVLIPITEKSSGNIIAIFGIDYESGKWDNTILYETVEASILFTLLISAIAFIIRIRQKKILLEKEIKQRDRLEKILQESNENQQLILDNMTEGLILAELIFNSNNVVIDCKVVAINAAFEQMTGMDSGNIVGQSFNELFISKYGFLKELFRTNLEKGEPLITEFYNEQQDTWRYISVSKPVNKRFVISFFDITELKNTEKELIKAKEKAEENDKLKTTFLANISHEIRTPMNGILGFAEILKHELLSQENQLDCIQYIEQSGTRMMNTIDDIINMSKIESAQMDLNISETNISEVAKFLYYSFKSKAESKGLQFQLDLPWSTHELIIKTDKEKILSIFKKLIFNALKYSTEGSIRFGFRKKAGHVECFVEDKGIGISLENSHKIFDRFIQADSGDKRVYEGMGLGLSLTKAYVEMLGGKIWLESEIGVGSTFYFSIPIV